MIKKSLGLIVALSTSCVSKKIYNDLENRYTDLKKRTDLCRWVFRPFTSKNGTQDALKSDLSKVTLARDKWLADYGALSNKMDVMQESYNALEKKQ
jgi:chemotaxis protein MotB